MSSLLTLLLLAAAPEGAAAATPPAPQARIVGVARARIIAPMRVSLSAQGTLTQSSDMNAPRLITHSEPRRDGARVVDSY